MTSIGDDGLNIAGNFRAAVRVRMSVEEARKATETNSRRRFDATPQLDRVVVSSAQQRESSAVFLDEGKRSHRIEMTVRVEGLASG